LFLLQGFLPRVISISSRAVDHEEGTHRNSGTRPRVFQRWGIILEVEVGGEIWTIEVGQPWRNERAGLKDSDLSEGVEIRVIGEPAADKSDRRLKAERLFLGNREYILYPDRD